MAKLPKVDNSPFEKNPRFYVMKGDKEVSRHDNIKEAFKSRDKLGVGHSVVRTAIKTFKVKTHQWDHPGEVEE